MCECSPGFEGDGYVCAGSVLFSVASPITVQDYFKTVAHNIVIKVMNRQLSSSKKKG